MSAKKGKRKPVEKKPIPFDEAGFDKAPEPVDDSDFLGESED